MTFAASETGAVTVDWVVLTGALVGLGLAAMAVVSSGVEDTSGDVRDQLTATTIYTSFSQRKYARFYEARLARAVATGSATPAEVAAAFDETIAENEALSDADLIAKIQDRGTNSVPGWQAGHDGLAALDPATATAAEIATAIGSTESAVNTKVANDHGGDLSAYYTERATFYEQKLASHEATMQMADERGLTY